MKKEQEKIPENAEQKESGEVSRRDFLVGAGTVVVGGIISSGLLSGCKPETETTTVEIPTTKTVTKTVEIPTTVISTVQGSGSIVTTTKTITTGASTTSIPLTITDGTYSGTMKGMGGNVTVTLTYKNSKITDCEIVGEDETEGVGGRAIKIMPTRFILAGDINVDGVSGATVTSTAILKAARIAYNKSVGGSASPIKMKPGTYIGSARGDASVGKLAVNVTVSEDKILSIERWDPVDTCETEVILNSVFDRMVPRIIEHQSLLVDSVCGATGSSAGVRNATENALAVALAAGGSDEWAILNFYELPEKPGLGTTETINADLVVVGAGNGGIMCATSAVETYKKQTGKDLKVILVEKAGKIGGTSALTHEPLGVNPPRLMADYNNGQPWVTDVPVMLEEWKNWTKDPDGNQRAKEEMIDLLVSESGNTIDWLWYEHGFTFGFPKTPMFPPGSGNPTGSRLACFNYFQTGGNYELRRPNVDKWLRAMIRDYVEKAGGSLMLETEGYELVYDAALNRVTGVKARDNINGTEYVINAKAVVLAGGGFAGSSERTKEWLANNKYHPMLASGDWRINGMYQNDGQTIAAAIAIGAYTCNWAVPPCSGLACPSEMHVFPIHTRDGVFNDRRGRFATWTYNDVPFCLAGMDNLLGVDINGNRMLNEEYINASSTIAMSKDSLVFGSRWYRIMDKAFLEDLARTGFPQHARISQNGYFGQGGVPVGMPIPEMFDVLEEGIKAGLIFKGNTIAELADEIGVNPATLIATVNRYNELCDKGVDEDFGKRAEYLLSIETGPFYAVIGCIQPFQITGGLNIDTKFRVLRAVDRETPIYGLYAICGDSANVLYSDYSHYSGGGPAQGWTTTSGRLSGICTAEYIKEVL